MTKMSDVYKSNSKYLTAEEIKGKQLQLTISHYTVDEFEKDGKKENKTVIYFVGKTKGAALNVTNANIMSYMFGDEQDDWVGQQIVLTTHMTTFGGKPTLGLTIREPIHQRQDPITSGGPELDRSHRPTPDFPGDRPMLPHRRAINADWDDEIEF